MITETRQIEITARNEQIATRFTTLAESQPLASANRIIGYLAGEYNLTPQYIGKILREQGIKTANTQEV